MPVAKTATVDATTTGASSRKGSSGGPFSPVLGRARGSTGTKRQPVLASFSATGGMSSIPMKTCGESSCPDREDGHALGREQQEEDGARCRRQALVAVRSPTHRSHCSAQS